MKKKILLIVVVILIIMLSICTLKVNAETLTGSTEDNNWSFNTETGTLTFTGTGEITDNCFSQVSRNDVKHIKIEEGIESIGVEKSVFYGLVNLEDVEFPNSLNEIGYYCFSGCTKLQQIELPKNLTRLVWASFAGCTSLTTVTIPKSVTDSGANSFVGCESLNEILVEQGNTKYVSENGILYSKDKTELVAYPIGKSYKEFDVPSNITKLGWGAFDGSKNLEKIVVPNSVTEIEGAVFQDCEKAKIYCKSDSKVKEYIEEHFTAEGIEQYLVVDDTAPTISLEQQDKNIIVTSTDTGVGLSKEAYSLDRKNWTSSNKFTVEKSGTYTIYVRDRLGNVATKEIVVTIVEKTENDDKVADEKTTDEKNNNEKKDNEEVKNDDTNKEEKNMENNTSEKATKNQKSDDTASKKAFGQYGSTPIITSLIVITSILGCLGYQKFKKTIIK